MFTHRENEDGSWDSICLECYLTVATKRSEEELSKDEP
jgi:hypothetical protein